MIDLSGYEQGALEHFLNTDTPLRTAFFKFLNHHLEECRALCTAHMATVPRNYEAASDWAAKAQVYEEFWEMLSVAASDQVSSSEPTAREEKE